MPATYAYLYEVGEIKSCKNVPKQMAMSQATHPKMELCIVLGKPDGNLGENLQRNLRMVFIQCDRAPEICEEGWKKQLVEVFCSCHHFQSFVHKVMSTEEEIRYCSTFIFKK